jgi:hypothetical protein
MRVGADTTKVGSRNAGGRRCNALAVAYIAAPTTSRDVCHVHVGQVKNTRQRGDAQTHSD